MQHSVLDSMLRGGTEAVAASDDDEKLAGGSGHTGGAAAAEVSDEEGEVELPAVAVLPLPDHGTSSVPSNAMSSIQSHEQELPAERTVFIRGLRLDTTQQQLQSTMLTYGPVKACRCAIRIDSNNLTSP